MAVKFLDTKKWHIYNIYTIIDNAQHEPNEHFSVILSMPFLLHTNIIEVKQPPYDSYHLVLCGFTICKVIGYTFNFIVLFSSSNK